MTNPFAPGTLRHYAHECAAQNRSAHSLYTRAVLPDEIDEDPVEPAPDEGLVERVAKVGQLAWIERSRDEESTERPWLFVARAALAEIAQYEAGENPSLRRRVAELEAELKRRENAEAHYGPDPFGETAKLRVRISNQDALIRNKTVNLEKRTEDLATVTRERDDWMSTAAGLTRELTEAKATIQQVAGCHISWPLEAERQKAIAFGLRAELERRTRELAEAKAQRETDAAAISDRDAEIEERRDDQIAMRDENARLTKELAEAREEFFNAMTRIHDAAGADDVVRCHEIAGRWLDAHRAKTSGDERMAAERPDPPLSPELLYETAPRLTKGARYEIIDAQQVIGAERQISRRVGEVTTASGKENHRGEGWYDFGSVFLYRVVRVEPEKAIQRDPDMGEARTLADAVNAAHDGGGERAGQANECVACLASGEHRPGCSRAAQPAFDHEGSELDSSGVVYPDGKTRWAPNEILEVIRRAGQPEAKANPHIGSALDAGHMAETGHVAESPETCEECAVEKPLLGPHAGTDVLEQIEAARQHAENIPARDNPTAANCYEAIHALARALELHIEAGAGK